MTNLDDTRHCPMCEDSAKKILELEQQLSESMCREEALRHENHNLNWALGSDGYGKMYLPEEQEAADQAHAETLERIATMKKRGDKLAELEQRVKVLTDGLQKIITDGDYTAPEGMKRIAQETFNAAPQQTAAQIEREHVEWMMKLPSYGCFIWDAHGGWVQTSILDKGMAGVVELVAIPPLPKESNSPETDLDEALRRQ